MATSIKSDPSDRSQDRVQILEDETKLLKNDVQKFLSIIASQTQQLARQEKILNEIRDERNAKAEKKLTIMWIILFVIVMLVIIMFYFGIPNVNSDTMLHLTTIVTPVKLPFITTGVKVRFTMGDLGACVKGALLGAAPQTIDLSLS